MSNGKVMIVHLIAGLMQKTWLNKCGFSCIKHEPIFSSTVWTTWRRYNVKVDLSNYSTKTNVKTISHIDTSSFVLKSNLANLKTEVDK